jgi:transcriptional regulator with XRE-family HTH domain
MTTPLRNARYQAERKLEEVAAAVGISEGALSRIECAKQKASPAVAERLARYFGTISELEILYPERFLQKSGDEEGRAA